MLVARLVSRNCRRAFSSNSENHFLEYVDLKSRNGDINKEKFRNEAVLVYFSAGWCSTCKELTPKIKKFYENTKDQGLDVVWVSRDRSADDQVEYYEEQLPPWPYVPFGTKDIRGFLKLFEIKSIPTLILVDKEGKVVDDGARVQVEKNYETAEASLKVLKEWRKTLGLN
ncbi:unnamed protein product [Bursaphelenchus okinawaensis]|uniref:Thioredoxin domain-containing protein n=1 Tax=Bursaphelenchus okinawaensis TaxID=465554 RepID=A0A811KUG3_9BILA|nr:unnamed protein product [Bursaphelenchus okinawaensis]CAG9112394.1 unnamed protein product [Bursaphelenchus okinawaensis]